MDQKTLITSFPSIGENRELKKALEKFWANKISQVELFKTASKLQKDQYELQKEAGIDLISCNDFTLYDNMLDTAVMLNAIPERFKKIDDPIERYFAMARGVEDKPAMEMTKWFNTNYHYIVPELSPDTEFSLNFGKISTDYNLAVESNISPKINIIGPITFLGLSKTTNGNSPYNHYEDILSVYEKLILRLQYLSNKTIYLQIEEPIFCANPTEQQISLIKETYNRLANLNSDIKIIFSTYFEHCVEAVKEIAQTSVWAIALDFVHGPKNIEALEHLNDKTLVAGVVDGRNVWVNNIDNSVELLDLISEIIDKDKIIVSTSCSLMHVPYTVKNEPESPVKQWMSFANEKLNEVTLISKLFFNADLSQKDKSLLEKSRNAIISKKSSSTVNNPEVRKRVESITKTEREENFAERIKKQKDLLSLPVLPTTTIGSFPQTPEIRAIRREFKLGEISIEKYENAIKIYIDECVDFQEKIGLDVLVHGEPERNDMVEYFGEMLTGFHFTKNGWVKSYGSRCVKPPVIYGDVFRENPMTVKWISYAQAQTKKIMKGMLTGPVTILNWSFVRDDLPRSEVSRQIAVAISDEIDDLQNHGIKIIQVDEAAFKEGYPLKKENIKDYEKWAVDNFKLAVSKAKKETQIHTHMCYSEFNEIIDTIEAMDADVITIETSRSGNELLKVFKNSGYKNEIGPGVYDIHSPVVPTKENILKQIKELVKVLPAQKLWINPDCGLKTRSWNEVQPSLINMVEAVKEFRTSL